MIKFDAPIEGTTKCIPLDQLEQYRGWSLIALVPVTEVPERPKMSSISPVFEDRSPLPPIQSARAIITKSADSTISDMEETIAALHRENASAHERLRETQHNYKQAQKERDAARCANGLLSAGNADLQNHNRQLEEQHRKLEVDLAKVREHIGSKVYDEIIEKES